MQLKKFEDGEKELKSKLEAKIAERDERGRADGGGGGAGGDKLEEVEGVKERKKKVLQFDSVVDDSSRAAKYLAKTFLRRIKRKKPKDDSLAQAERPQDNARVTARNRATTPRPRRRFRQRLGGAGRAADGVRRCALGPRSWRCASRRPGRRHQRREPGVRGAQEGGRRRAAKSGEERRQGSAALEEEMAELQREKHSETMTAPRSVVPLRRARRSTSTRGGSPTTSPRASCSAARGPSASTSASTSSFARRRRCEGSSDLRREPVALQRARAEGMAKNRALDDSATRADALVRRAHRSEKLEHRSPIPRRASEEVKVSLEEQELARAASSMRRWHRESPTGEGARGDRPTRRKSTASLKPSPTSEAAQRTSRRSSASEALPAFVDPRDRAEVEARERDRLVAVVNAQAKEIDTLKAAIGALSVKGRPQTRRFFSS